MRIESLVCVCVPGKVRRSVHRLRREVQKLAHFCAVGHVMEELHQLEVVVLVREVALQHLRRRSVGHQNTSS